jgi:hypothetical protein
MFFSLPTFVFAMESSYEFIYEDVYACSTKKFDSFDDLDTVTSLQTYFIHTSKIDEHFVIFLHGQEFPSFTKIKSSALYLQAGGLKWLEFYNLSDDITKFKLYFKKGDGTHITNLTFDKNALSAVRKTSWQEESQLLICWDYIKKTNYKVNN